MNTVRFFLPHKSCCVLNYTKDNVIVPYIGELVFIESECQEFVVKHVMHGYDEEGNDMADVLLDYPEENYYDSDYWCNQDELDHDDYLDNLADDCNCPCGDCKDKSESDSVADAFISEIKTLFNKLGYDIDIEVHSFEV